jgi:SnoaL-like domain
MNPFREAMEAGNLEGAMALFTEDVAFRSPAVFRPYEGRDRVATVLRATSRVLQDFRFEREIGAADASDHALVFRATVGDREIEGCDFLHTNADGLIDEFFVMVRPLSGILALAEAMEAELPADPRPTSAEASG